MSKLRLRLDDLSVESFDTSTVRQAKGTVFGEQCTCETVCTCPGCATCEPTFQETCALTCDDESCFSCQRTCRFSDQDTCWNCEEP